eukprot:620010-Rhodomonas_salina.1
MHTVCARHLHLLTLRWVVPTPGCSTSPLCSYVLSGTSVRTVTVTLFGIRRMCEDCCEDALRKGASDEKDQTKETD